MIVLDTNVVSELQCGVEKLPGGERKRHLQSGVAELITKDFAQRILSFDGPSASTCAGLVAQREKQGLPMDLSEAQIAAICMTQGVSLASRNQKHFQGLGLNLINPWA
jgi:toxin FitB